MSSAHVLEHVADFAMVLSEVARVLRPGGLVLYDTINRSPLSRLATITIAERFKILHSLSTMITLGHIAGAGVAILRLAGG